MAGDSAFEQITYGKVQGELSGCKDQDKKRGKEKCVWGGSIKFFGIGKNRKERLPVGGDVRYKQVDGQGQRDDSGSEAEKEQDAPHALQPTYQVGVEGREGHPQAGEKVYDFVDARQFAEASLDELPTPVKADSKQQRRLQA